MHLEILLYGCKLTKEAHARQFGSNTISYKKLSQLLFNYQTRIYLPILTSLLLSRKYM